MAKKCHILYNIVKGKRMLHIIELIQKVDSLIECKISICLRRG